MNQSHRTRIKICGLTREADVAAAVAAGADAIGFVLYASSQRAVTVARAAALARLLPPFVMPVCLFVNAEPALIEQATQAMPTTLLQFHGDETAAQCQALHQVTGRPYLRAARMAPGFALLDFMADFSSAAGILLDTPVEGYGGGGKVFDWSLVPRHAPRPVVLSGGLNPANVIAGIMQVRPWAVDVSSGVELARGLKDAALLRQFCDAVHEADSLIADADA